MMTYEKYCSDCLGKGHKPTMTKKQFEAMMGTTEVVKPIEIKPKPKPVVKQSLTTEKTKVEKPKIEKKKAEPKPKKEKNPKRVFTRLTGMTKEEIKAHRNNLRKIRIEKAKRDGTYKPRVRTAEERAEKRQYYREYHESRKNDPEYMAKRAKRTREYRERLKNGTN